MKSARFPHSDLESFERWAIAVLDQLTEAVNAVLALEQGGDTYAYLHDESALCSDVSAGELADELVKEIVDFARNRNPERPSWFRPIDAAILNIGDLVALLLDYIEEHREELRGETETPRTQLMRGTILPALKHHYRFFEALTEAGHLTTEEFTGPPPDNSGGLELDQPGEGEA